MGTGVGAPRREVCNTWRGVRRREQVCRAPVQSPGRLCGGVQAGAQPSGPTCDNLLEGPRHHEGECGGVGDECELSQHHEEGDDPPRQRDSPGQQGVPNPLKVGRARERGPQALVGQGEQQQGDAHDGGQLVQHLHGAAVGAGARGPRPALQEDLGDGPPQPRQHCCGHDQQEADQVELGLPRHQQQQARGDDGHHARQRPAGALDAPRRWRRPAGRAGWCSCT